MANLKEVQMRQTSTTARTKQEQARKLRSQGVPVANIVRQVGASRSSVYSWTASPKSDKAFAESVTLVDVKHAHAPTQVKSQRFTIEVGLIRFTFEKAA
jgi:DNA invertase Pin-like site-specific DNA recombinase